MRKIGKVGIIGAGHVGSHVAAMLASQGVCGQIALLDIDQKKALAHSQDIADGMSYWPRPVRVWAGDYQDLADADLVVMAACGAAIEQNRLDELAATVAVMDQIVPQLKACGFGIPLGSADGWPVCWARRPRAYPPICWANMETARFRLFTPLPWPASLWPNG